jgi:hypothetical protein
MMRPAYALWLACSASWWSGACSSETTRKHEPAPADATSPQSLAVDAIPPPVVQGFDTFDRAVRASCDEADTRSILDFFGGRVQRLALFADFRCLASNDRPVVIEFTLERATVDDDRGPIRVGQFKASEIVGRSSSCAGVLGRSRGALEIIAGQDAQEPMELLMRSRSKPRFETTWGGFDLVLTGSKVETGETLCRFVITPTPT